MNLHTIKTEAIERLYKKFENSVPYARDVEEFLSAELELAVRAAFEATEVKAEELVEYEEEKTVWCPKQNLELRKYWSHHDEEKHCENCGSKVEIRTSKSVKDYEKFENINLAIVEINKKISDFLK